MMKHSFNYSVVLENIVQCKPFGITMPKKISGLIRLVEKQNITYDEFAKLFKKEISTMMNKIFSMENMSYGNYHDLHQGGEFGDEYAISNLELLQLQVILFAYCVPFMDLRVLITRINCNTYDHLKSRYLEVTQSIWNYYNSHLPIERDE